MDVQAKINSNYSPPLQICRCCLRSGCYKDISNEYFYCGQREVYEQMLKDSFNIEIPGHQKVGVCAISRLICEDCITKLRDAYAFKQTVERSLENFEKILVELNGNLAETNDNVCLKIEEIKFEELCDEEFDARLNGGIHDFKDDSSFDDDDEILANIKLGLSRIKNVDTLTENQISKKIRRGRKKAKIKEVNDTDKIKKEATEKIAEIRGNAPFLRKNSLKLIANSTICVFQWNKSRYRCFCCKEPFSDMNLLREHTNTKHTLENIEKKIIIQQNRLVKVEISMLFCKICGNQLENLSVLRKHLETHDIKFELEEDLLVPYKIESSNLQCQICNQNFTMFRLLNIHMNRHFQKQVCHICGSGFSNLVFLNLHKTRAHRPIACKDCKLTFATKIDKKEHDVTVHNLKIERKLRFPCPYCQERFYQEHLRVSHLVQEHGMRKPEYKCDMCPKTFLTRSLCNNHVKMVHMKEKNQECDVCHRFFYTRSDLARHKDTHTGEKKFPCNFCNTLLSTKTSLRRHMKRVHPGME